MSQIGDWKKTLSETGVGPEIEDWRDGDGECQSKDPEGEPEKERPTVSGGDGGLDARRGQKVRG